MQRSASGTRPSARGCFIVHNGSLCLGPRRSAALPWEPLRAASEITAGAGAAGARSLSSSALSPPRRCYSPGSANHIRCHSLGRFSPFPSPARNVYLPLSSYLRWLAAGPLGTCKQRLSIARARPAGLAAACTDVGDAPRGRRREDGDARTCARCAYSLPGEREGERRERDERHTPSLATNCRVAAPSPADICFWAARSLSLARLSFSLVSIRAHTGEAPYSCAAHCCCLPLSPTLPSPPLYVHALARGVTYLGLRCARGLIYARCAYGGAFLKATSQRCEF